jgi:DNA-binding CsgD family transcriptional regulator
LAEATVAEVDEQPEEVIAVLTPLEDGPRDDEAPMFAPLWAPKLAGALISVGRLADARRRVDLLDTLTRRRDPELAVVTATLEGRIAASEGDGRAALRSFDRAEAAVTPDTPVLDRFDLGRHFGVELLRTGRLDEARQKLRAADQLVAPLGSGPLVARVRADLDAAGEAPGVEAVGPEADLTERERDVVALVRQGYTNREVAETLFVSIKAVEYHMGNIFSKLGISSRRQLRPR